MSTELVIHTGEPQPDSRHGTRVLKTYGADPAVREHRANMFRCGIPPLQQPTWRTLARGTLWVSGILLIFALPAAASDNDAAGFVLLLVVAAGLAIAVLLHKRSVALPAADPAHFDRTLEHFKQHSEGEALRRLSYDLAEDVYVKHEFGSVNFGTVPEVVSMPHGLALYPHTRAFTVLLRKGSLPRYCSNFRHHVFATKRGLAYVCTSWDFLDEGVAPPGSHLLPRVTEMNQWTWRTIENLQVGEYSLVIQTIGGNKVHLPYVGPPPGRPSQEPGAYDWFYNTPAAQQARQARRQSPNGTAGAPLASPLDDPFVRQEIERQAREAREGAIQFVNTVNSLRNEWEDRQ